ncbi:MAG: hypothetical protein JWM64_3023 [Frankiales bacterium]|nr:hypothetical protein [Frankiales bacterium]
MDRRRSSVPPADGQDRRRGDRRGGQAAVLAHRRATDVRLDAAGAAGLLQRRAFEQAVAAARPVPVPRRPEQAAVVDLRDRDTVELVRCPLCDVLHDRLWLFRHVAVDHP